MKKNKHNSIETVMIPEEYNCIFEEQNKYDLQYKVAQSIRTLKLAAEMSKTYYKAPLIICYSGGKDSSVLLNLAEKSLEPKDYLVQNSHTTVDAPETVYFIRDEFKRLNQKGVETEIKYAKYEDGSPATMWNYMPIKLMPPTRLVRYCCEKFKEQSTPNRLACLGVRASESSKRQGRDTFGIRGGTYKDAMFYSLEHAEEVYQESLEINDDAWDCTLIKMMKENKDTIVNPIYEWTDKDIWDYIRQEDLKVNPLYSRGYDRVGCIGCPLATHKIREKQFRDYPKYKQMYISAFERMIQERKRRGLECKWETGEEVFDWWMETYKYNVKGQYNLFDSDP